MALFRSYKRDSLKPSSFKPVVVVTGCSSGVGLALADLLQMQTQYRVVITARAKSLEGLRTRFPESDRFLLRPLDVTSKSERESLIQEINSRWGGVNILVNNAGIAYRAVSEHMSDQDELHQMEVNYLGPIALARLILPKMRTLGRGKIINVSSVSGMLAMPTMGSYSASKYALEGMSEALWYELRPLGINVSLIQPGFIRSASFQHVYYTEQSKPEAIKDGLYADYYDNIAPFIAKLMAVSLTTPESVAKKILKVIRTENPPLWIPVTLDAFVFYYLRRLIPRRMLLPLLFALLPNSHKWAKAYTHKRTSS